MYSRKQRRRRAMSGGAAAGNGWLTWRNVQPVLLKSGGVVGLAGIIVSLISSTFWITGPSAQSRHSEPVIAAQDAGPTIAAVATKSAAPARLSPSLEPSNVRAVSLTRRAPDAGSTQAPAVLGQKEPSASVQPIPTSPSAQSRPLDAQPAAFQWKDEAVNCPRDWLSAGGSGTGSATAHCADAPASRSPAIAAVQPKPVPSATVAPAPQPAAPIPTHAEAVSPVVAETAASPAKAVPAARTAQPAPRLPAARPAERPVRVAAATPARVAPAPKKAAAQTIRVSSPPDCGRRHAFWRYIDKRRSQKTWYCK